MPQPRYSGTPDGTLQPEVTVCGPIIGAACGPTIARFTTTEGTILEKVRYESQDLNA